MHHFDVPFRQRRHPMRTTVELPEKLLEEVQRLYGAKTRTALLILALQRLRDTKRIEDLRSLKGKLKLRIDLDHLRKVRDKT